MVRKEQTEDIKRAWRERVVGKRSRGRQRLRCRRDLVERDTRKGDLTEGDAKDRMRWVKFIKAADP